MPYKTQPKRELLRAKLAFSENQIRQHNFAFLVDELWSSQQHNDRNT